jgi:hypothetical protein
MYSASSTIIASTGMTLLASYVYNSAGTLTLDATFRNISGAWKEIGTSGVYLFDSASVPDSARGVIIAHTGSISALSTLTTSNTYGAWSVNPGEVERPEKALPNAAANASGGLPTFGGGAGQINLSAGRVFALDSVGDPIPISSQIAEAVRDVDNSNPTPNSLGANIKDIHTDIESVSATVGSTAGEVQNLTGRLTETRAGYLDNLSAGVVPTATEIAIAVWAAGTRTLSSFGSLVADIWAYATRTLTANPTTGGGAFARTIIATTDGSTALVGAQIRLTSGSSTFHGTSGSDGTVVFSVDAGTYTLSATASGRTYTPSTLVVSASGTTTITLTAVSIPPAADPSQTTAYLTTRDGQGAAKASAVVYFRLKAPAGTADAWDRYDFTATSNGSGSLTVTLARLASYEARLGDRGTWVAFTTTDTSTYALPQILGQYGR